MPQRPRWFCRSFSLNNPPKKTGDINFTRSNWRQRCCCVHIAVLLRRGCHRCRWRLTIQHHLPAAAKVRFVDNQRRTRSYAGLSQLERNPIEAGFLHAPRLSAHSSSDPREDEVSGEINRSRKVLRCPPNLIVSWPPLGSKCK